MGVTEVTARSDVMELSPEEIFEKNVVWVAGGYIMAKKEVNIISSIYAGYCRYLDIVGTNRTNLGLFKYQFLARGAKMC